MQHDRSPVAHRGWYSRGYLPHFDNPTLIQMITFRLADSMPAAQLAFWNKCLQYRSDPKLREIVERYLDAGYGSCCLKQDAIARLVEDELLHFDGERYRLLEWVIMPNHVHVLVETFDNYPLPQIMHSWKSYTAKQINNHLKRQGPLWQKEYFDRYIRNALHLSRARQYIHENPVRAGLAECTEDWSYGSANRRLCDT